MLKIVHLLVFVFVVSACGGRVKIAPGENTASNGVINIYSNWVKNKGSKYDIQLGIKNISDKDILIMLSDLNCSKGETQGTIKHTFFNTGERTIDIRRGEVKEFNLVCNLGSEPEGDYKIEISRMYDNPSGDGLSRGKVMGKEVVWKYRGDK